MSKVGEFHAFRGRTLSVATPSNRSFVGQNEKKRGRL